MRRRVIVTLAALLLSALAGAAIGSQSAARDITPIPGRHAEVRTLFHFYVKDTPDQRGWRAAEYKDEGGQSYYKADASPGCGEWTVAPGTEPGLILTPGGTNCPGFPISFGVLYWFDAPPIKVTPSPGSSPTATVTPGATASPTVAQVTPTPSPQVTPTPTPTARILYGNMCDPQPTPVYPHSITIYGQGGLTSPAFHWWCISATPDLVIIVPIATYEAAYDSGPRKLLQDLGR